MKTFKAFLKQNWMTIAVLIYLVSPIDLIPEAALPLLGSTDDAGLLLLELARQYHNFKKTSGTSNKEA